MRRGRPTLKRPAPAPSGTASRDYCSASCSHVAALRTTTQQQTASSSARPEVVVATLQLRSPKLSINVPYGYTDDSKSDSSQRLRGPAHLPQRQGLIEMVQEANVNEAAAALQCQATRTASLVKLSLPAAPKLHLQR
jgi:hypothetical protein